MEVLRMLEGMQQTYPGVTGAYPPSMIPQSGFNSPLAGVMSSGIPGLFANAALGRPVDPVTQAYLQQAQIAQHLAQQGIPLAGAGVFGSQPFQNQFFQSQPFQSQPFQSQPFQSQPFQSQQWGGIGQGYMQYDPMTALQLQHIIHQQQLAQLSGRQGIYGNPLVGQTPFANPLLGAQGGVFGNPLQHLLQNPLQQIGQFGRPYGLDPMTVALLQQQLQQQSQPWQQPFARPPLQNPIGAGAYGPLGAWS